jgi:hypothetical protein
MQVRNSTQFAINPAYVVLGEPRTQTNSRKFLQEKSWTFANDLWGLPRRTLTPEPSWASKAKSQIITHFPRGVQRQTEKSIMARQFETWGFPPLRCLCTSQRIFFAKTLLGLHRIIGCLASSDYLDNGLGCKQNVLDSPKSPSREVNGSSVPS